MSFWLRQQLALLSVVLKKIRSVQLWISAVSKKSRAELELFRDFQVMNRGESELKRSWIRTADIKSQDLVIFSIHNYRMEGKSWIQRLRFLTSTCLQKMAEFWSSKILSPNSGKFAVECFLKCGKSRAPWKRILARGRGFANLLFAQFCWRLTRSALLCYSDG